MDRVLARIESKLRTRRPVLAAIVIVFLVLALWFVPRFEVSLRAPDLEMENRLKLEDSIRKTLAQILGGAFVLGGLYLSWRTLVQNKEGQVTDRFYKAVEQLGKSGPEHQAIRIGGIYALERIMRDSPKDQWTVVEVLSAYVREHARQQSYDKVDVTQSIKRMDMRKASPTYPRPVPALDIQAILTVLGRRHTGVERESSERVDLRNTDLRGADLRDADLKGALLCNAHLEYAHLEGAHLQDANLSDAHLEVAYLTDAHLEGASLVDAYLEGSDLSGAYLARADLTYAHLQHAILEKADARNATFAGANVTGAHVDQMKNVTKEQVGEAVVRVDASRRELVALKEIDSHRAVSD